MMYIALMHLLRQPESFVGGGSRFGSNAVIALSEPFPSLLLQSAAACNEVWDSEVKLSTTDGKAHELQNLHLTEAMAMWNWHYGVRRMTSLESELPRIGKILEMLPLLRQRVHEAMEHMSYLVEVLF